MPSKLLIFVPTYNERDNAPLMFQQLLGLKLDADIVFLDDNSPDGTGQALDELARQHPCLTVIHRSGKLGIGSAHQDGIAYAYEHGYSRLLTMDCDFTHSPEDIPRFLAEAESNDVVVGSRFLKQDSLPGWNLMRRSLTRFGHFLTRRLLNIEHDATGAFRLYRLDRIPREIFSLVAARGYAFFFESLFVLARNNCRICEVPIVLPARTYGHSKMSWREASRSGFHVFQLWASELSNPAHFRIGKPPHLDAHLADPQNWDDYWGKKGRTDSVLYELIAAFYRKRIISPNTRRALERNFPRGARLLHAGCGSGQVDAGLQQQYRINALDISVNALTLYHRNNPQVEQLTHGSILNIPCPSDSFDGVYNMGVLEHFTADEIEQILREFRRVLKPGGKVLVFWPHRRATSVMVLGAAHWILNRVLKRDVQLHPPEISLLTGKPQAQWYVQRAGLEFVSYTFGPRDGFVQAILVAQKSASPETAVAHGA